MRLTCYRNILKLILYHEKLGFEIRGIEKNYYNDAEDAYKMRKYFKQEKKDKNEITIEIKDEIKYEDIKDIFEEVDENGKAKQNLKEEEKDKKDGKEDRKKKKKHKKKH